MKHQRTPAHPDGAATAASPAPEEKKGRRRLSRMEIERAKGGFVARHHYSHSGGKYVEPETHAIGGNQALLAHVGAHFGGASDQGGE